MEKTPQNSEVQQSPSPAQRRAGRRSIRLKGHDYAGGGLYFVTLCAHREFISAAKGCPFGAGQVSPEQRGPFGATQASPVREIIEERIRITAEKFPEAQWKEWVIMPDHFHALIQMDGGGLRLGDVIGGFKSAVSRELRRAQASQGGARQASQEGATQASQEGARQAAQEGATQASPVRRGEAGLDPLSFRIWHRNYYEMIVRSAEAERKIAGYIRMNPWKCVQQFENGLRGIGNPALWSAEKLGVLCSRHAPHIGRIPVADVYLGGWHSPKEKEMLDWLLEKKRRIIACPAWGIESMRIPDAWLPALEANRMLILEMQNRDGDLAAAEQRNRFVADHADKLFVPYKTPGGMLEKMLEKKE